jgi:hypothetical protein
MSGHTPVTPNSGSFLALVGRRALDRAGGIDGGELDGVDEPVAHPVVAAGRLVEEGGGLLAKGGSSAAPARAASAALLSATANSGLSA